MQKYDEALDCYNVALALDPNNKDIMTNKQNLLNIKIKINWDEVLQKEVCGIGNYDLGVVVAGQADHVITSVGMINKNKFYLPKKSCRTLRWAQTVV